MPYLGGGYLFGLPVGFVVDSLGATIGATAAFHLCRTVERQFEECSSSLKWSKDRVVELETKLTSVHEEFCSSKDAAAANEEHLSAEISTNKVHNGVYKEITDCNIRLNCKVVLEPEFCRSIVPEQVLDQWVNALCESMILGSQKVYYPFKDCSAMLIDDGVEVVTMSECPYCRRLFCAQCKIPWHSGLGCDEFKRGIVKDDPLVMEMTRNKN
ncbi:hypothetical protein GIB67_007482 [Kingdonia uniflora]|uniref:IBR domain-containing protein n=1 Tax=Kingdonia uniflora TaxID=39325 RepID=A0A7J7LW32_9MAGN|nr:hypothetical protein GIB67_007482 [Kingdonia uniflora]